MAIKYIFPRSLYNTNDFGLVISGDIVANENGLIIRGSLLKDWIGNASIKIASDNWFGGVVELEGFIKEWVGQDSVVEDVLNKYIKSGIETIEGFRDEWVWARFSDLKSIEKRYAGLKYVVRIIVQYWLNQQINIEGSNLLFISVGCNVEQAEFLVQWLGLQGNIEGFDNKWFRQVVGLKGFYDLYVDNKYYVEVKIEQYSGLQNDVEWYKEQYDYLNYLVEGIWKRYSQQKTYVEVYADNYVRGNWNVEDLKNRYVGCEVFVAPKVYIEPEFGKYENSIEVSIKAELMPQSLKYGFGLNMGNYKDKFMVYRSRRLYVEADYGNYVIKKQGDYVIHQLNGKKVYSDYTDVAWLTEELLWKKY
jgi:hypothetical protein